MADNTSKSSLSTLSTKQKVIGALTVVIFGFIIYEVIGLFSADKSAEPAMAPAPQASSAKPKQMSATMPTAPASAPAASAPATAQPVTFTSVNAITPSKENIDFQQQQQQQQAYLESINQLQLLKVRREIAETNQAIASARLATETANKNMSDLLTQPTLPQVPAGNYAVKLVNPIAGAPQNLVPSTDSTVQPARPQPVLEVPFVVISVSMQFSRWNAVLGYQDKLYSVSIGDTLFDGSTVAAINKSGVTLMKDGKRRKISIQATI